MKSRQIFFFTTFFTFLTLALPLCGGPMEAGERPRENKTSTEALRRNTDPTTPSSSDTAARGDKLGARENVDGGIQKPNTASTTMELISPSDLRKLSSASFGSAQQEEASSDTGSFEGRELTRVPTKFTTSEELAAIRFPEAPTSLIKSAAASEKNTFVSEPRRIAVLAKAPSPENIIEPVVDETDLHLYETIVFKPADLTPTKPSLPAAIADASEVKKQAQPAAATQPTSVNQFARLRMPEPDANAAAAHAYPELPTAANEPAVATAKLVEPSAPPLDNYTPIAYPVPPDATESALEAVATFATTGTPIRQNTQSLEERGAIISKAQESISSVIDFTSNYQIALLNQAVRDQAALPNDAKAQKAFKYFYSPNLRSSLGRMIWKVNHEQPLKLSDLQALKDQLLTFSNPRARGATPIPPNSSTLDKSAADAIGKTIEALQQQRVQGGFIDIRPYLASAACFLDAAKILSDAPPQPSWEGWGSYTEYYTQQANRDLALANATHSQKMAFVLLELGDAMNVPSEDPSITSDLTDCLDALTKIPKPVYSRQPTSTLSTTEQALKVSREQSIKLADLLHEIIDAKRSSDETKLTSLNRKLPFERLIAEEVIQQANLPKSPPSMEEAEWKDTFRGSSSSYVPYINYSGKGASAAKQWLDYNEAEAGIRDRKIEFLRQNQNTSFASFTPALAAFDKAIETCRLIKEQHLLQIDSHYQMKNAQNSISHTQDPNVQQGYNNSIRAKEQAIEASNQQLTSLIENYNQAVREMTLSVEAVAPDFNSIYDARQIRQAQGK